MDVQSTRPLYQQLAEELAIAIRAGELAPGTRLPTVRVLAEERGLDSNTVNRAYRLLAHQGLVEAQTRRGTLVCSPISPPQSPVAASPAALTTVRYAGSHDFCLDILARHIRATGIQLQLSPTGSRAGLTALAMGHADLAGIHLLDDSGDYNRSAVAQALPGREICLITLVEREQGLIVARGNPLGLTSSADLARPGLRIVSRQAGAGTQLLLERLLREARIDGQRIAGYERVVATHLAAAAAVAGGSADAALGLHAAAQALDLSFVPLIMERFELVLLAEQLARPWFGPLIEALAAPRFRAAVEALGGYDAAQSAWIRRVQGSDDGR